MWHYKQIAKNVTKINEKRVKDELEIEIEVDWYLKTPKPFSNVRTDAMSKKVQNSVL